VKNSIHRRGFLGAAAAGLSTGLSYRFAGAGVIGASEKIVVAIIGTGGRGTGHADAFARLPSAEVGYVCDVDSRRAGQAADVVVKAGGKVPKIARDLRRVLDDKAVDAVVIATCNHWHAPAAILACSADKHAYVEKPCSHNPREGELLVEAARKHKRVVQMGNQRRSWATIAEVVEQLQGGVIGRVYLARCFYNNTRGSIGRGHEAAVPEWLDYDLWQGPAPRRPYHDNYLHYNWHWFWHWGNGELGNNGIHSLDLCRWGMGVEFPVRVTSAGGRYAFEDDQETPDTHDVSFEFDGRKRITWEGISCNGYLPGVPTFSVIFYGDKGSLTLFDGGYTIQDLKGKETKKGKNGGGDQPHQTNFLAAIRSEATPNSEIAEGHKSTLLCHLGNIAHRTGRTLRCDPANGHVLDDPDAMKLWSREYEPGWEPKV
jgi:predicted dehydrogenase